MANRFPFSFSGNMLTVFVNGVPRSITEDQDNFAAVLDLVQGKVDGTADDLMALLVPRVQLERQLGGSTFGRVSIGQDTILVDGQPAHSYLAQRMIELLKKGFDIEPYAKFYDRLLRNPSKTAVDELFLWLEQANMPITEDGHFLAYKKVRQDYRSHHDGKTENNLGTFVEMPRNQVDDKRDHLCSYGLHFCSYQYLPSFGGSNSRVVILEIDPADVVSIPSDYNNAKGRACRYFVRDELSAADAADALYRNTPIVGSSGQTWDNYDRTPRSVDSDWDAQDENDEYDDSADTTIVGNDTEIEVDNHTKLALNDDLSYIKALPVEGLRPRTGGFVGTVWTGPEHEQEAQFIVYYDDALNVERAEFQGDLTDW